MPDIATGRCVLAATTTTSKARRLQRQRCTDRVLLTLAKSADRCLHHHGSAMTWSSKGKGKGAPSVQGKGKEAGEAGKWVWSPGGSKGGGQGYSPAAVPPKNPTHHAVLNQNSQLKDNIAKLKAQLAQAQASQQQTLSDTKQVLTQGKKLLEASDGPPLVCPVCGCEHYNQQKVKCRNKACKADLRAPREVPDAKKMENAQHISKNPLLTGYFQALLEEEGAVECLRQTIIPPKGQDQPAESSGQEDQDVPMAPSPPDAEEKRSKAEKTLEYLKSVDADPTIIQHQERILNGLPKQKTKPVKATQPLLDCGKLQQALSQATEYHSKMAEHHTQAVDKCQELVKQVQEALEQAKAAQADHKAQADKQLGELKVLVSKKQEQTKQVLQTPPSTEQADASLMIGELQSCLAKANLPPHLVKILETAEIRIGQGPSMSIMMGGSAGAEQSGPLAPEAIPTPKDPQAALWEAA